jgi:1,2-phenylacetyl-CoA epoxidase catalytic subunit
MIEALAGGSVEVLRGRLRKMLQEERYHSLHGRSWLHEVKAGAALERAWRESLEWIGPENGDVDELHREGRLAHGVRDLRRMLEERLERPAPQATIEWGSWEPIRRRTQTGGIDQATLDMLQGLAEKRYMPASG